MGEGVIRGDTGVPGAEAHRSCTGNRDRPDPTPLEQTSVVVVAVTTAQVVIPRLFFLYARDRLVVWVTLAPPCHPVTETEVTAPELGDPGPPGPCRYPGALAMSSVLGAVAEVEGCPTPPDPPVATNPLN